MAMSESQTPETKAKVAAFKLAGIDALCEEVIERLEGWSAPDALDAPACLDYPELVDKIKEIQALARPKS